MSFFYASSPPPDRDGGLSVVRRRGCGWRHRPNRPHRTRDDQVVRETRLEEKREGEKRYFC